MADGNDADLAAVARALLQANEQLTAALSRLIPPPRPAAPPSFIPTDLQRAILAALDGHAFRTDALARAVDCNRRTLFKDPGALPELVEAGKVANHKRCGYYRTDKPPADLGD